MDLGSIVLGFVIGVLFFAVVLGLILRKAFKDSWGWCIALAFAGALALPGCASFGGARHAATVGIVASHQGLALIQDTETLLVCGRPTAPQAPQCVPLETHRQIAQRLSRAFELEGDVAKVLRGLPAGAPQPDQIVKEIAAITDLVQAILADIPASQSKASLVHDLGLPTIGGK